MEMTKEEREISAELSRQGYFVKDKSNPTNVFILKQKATMRPERIDEIMKQADEGSDNISNDD